MRYFYVFFIIGCILGSIATVNVIKMLETRKITIEQSKIIDFPDFPSRIDSLICYYSELENIDPYLVAAIAYCESKGDTMAKGKTNDFGIMQVVPKHAIPEIMHPPINIWIGIRELKRWMLLSGTGSYNSGTDPNTKYAVMVLKQLEKYKGDTKR